MHLTKFAHCELLQCWINIYIKYGIISNSYNETEDISIINPWSVDKACLVAKHRRIKIIAITALSKKQIRLILLHFF